MGLTVHSTGHSITTDYAAIKKQTPDDKVIAFAGNPNVGKSTVFNSLTGMNQHTGNWPGKTVTSAQGFYQSHKHSYVLVDIPGTYSLMAHSAEEEVARNFICFAKPDAVVVVCDATCLERNLNLVLQTLEISSRVLICINLMDEAKRKGIQIDACKLQCYLHVPVIQTIGHKKKTLKGFADALDTLIDTPARSFAHIPYPVPIEETIAHMLPVVSEKTGELLNPRWLCLKLLEQDESLLQEINKQLPAPLMEDEAVRTVVDEALNTLEGQGITSDGLKDAVVSSLVSAAESISKDVVLTEKSGYSPRDRKLDHLLTSKATGYPIMLLMLCLIFWLTITGSNYPSSWLSNLLFSFQDTLSAAMFALHAPLWLHDLLILGIYRVLAWVVAVMLPPMAIFFPLFTLLEDSGYLPRVAYNLDKPFKKCNACGKQALCMCMGFGCNAAGVIGCRIIDSPRERLIAILTNCFVPCNGRFPTIIALISMFLTFSIGGFFGSALSAILLTCVILLGILMTFAASKFLSMTVLKGVPSSFTLELPPYRKPQLGKVIVRSIFDRTLFVLGRAIMVAAPAGLLIWMMANIQISGISLLNHCAGFLNPFAKLLGMDGIILMAFILGFPANEIVFPIIIMGYLSQGSLTDMSSLIELRELLIQNGWTWMTAISTMLFSLMHWPCSTTLMTIHKETGSIKWTAVALLLPTASGILFCLAFTWLTSLF